MKYFLKLYPPLKFKNGENFRSMETDQNNVEAGMVIDEILKEINHNSKFIYNFEDILLILNDRVAGREDLIENGQTLKIMLMAMGG